MRILTTLFISLLLISVLFPKFSLAQTDFSLSFDVTYSFDVNGNAAVKKRITLTNLNVNTYPSIYLVDIPDDASGVAAFSEKGELPTKTIQEAGRKMARISLQDQNVGINQQTNVTLSFETRSVAQRLENGWRVVIPPFSADEHIVSYTTRVNTPEAWGEARSISPESAEPGIWSMSERGQETIVISFGDVVPTNPAANSDQTDTNNIVIVIGVAVGVIITLLLFFTLVRKYNRNMSSSV